MIVVTETLLDGFKRTACWALPVSWTRLYHFQWPWSYLKRVTATSNSWNIFLSLFSWSLSMYINTTRVSCYSMYVKYCKRSNVCYAMSIGVVLKTKGENNVLHGESYSAWRSDRQEKCKGGSKTVITQIWSISYITIWNMVVKRGSWGTCDADSRYPDRYPDAAFHPFVKRQRLKEATRKMPTMDNWISLDLKHVADDTRNSEC